MYRPLYWPMYSAGMKHLPFVLLTMAFVCCLPRVIAAGERELPATPSFDPELAKRLGADERGMKTYGLCILKTGPKDAEIKGAQRQEIIAAHFENNAPLAEQGKLAA